VVKLVNSLAGKDKVLRLDPADDVVRMSLVTHKGATLWPPKPLALPPPSPKAAAKAAKPELTPEQKKA
jgi:hypothetical protein